MSARLCAALITTGMLAPGLLTGTAKADPVGDYTVQSAPAVCTTLDAYPSVAGVEGVVLAVMEDGFTGYEAGTIIGRSVIGYCPRHMPEIRAFIAKWGGTPVFSTSVGGRIGG